MKFKFRDFQRGCHGVDEWTHQFLRGSAVDLVRLTWEQPGGSISQVRDVGIQLSHRQTFCTDKYRINDFFKSARARAMRDLTVPMETPSTSAISL